MLYSIQLLPKGFPKNQRIKTLMHLTMQHSNTNIKWETDFTVRNPDLHPISQQINIGIFYHNHDTLYSTNINQFFCRLTLDGHASSFTYANQFTSHGLYHPATENSCIISSVFQETIYQI